MAPSISKVALHIFTCSITLLNNVLQPWGTHHTFMDFELQHGDHGIIVPQRSYDLNQHYCRLPTIPFHENGVWGFNIKNAIDKRLQGLADPGLRPMLSENAKKVTIRIMVKSAAPACVDLRRSPHRL